MERIAAADGFAGEAGNDPPLARLSEIRGTARPGRIGPNLFGISFGITGLAQAWGSAARYFDVPTTPSDVFFVVAAVTYSATLILYVGDVTRTRRARTELEDPISSPFIVLLGLVPMLLGVALAGRAHDLGVAVFAVSLVFTIGVGGLMVGQWVVSGVPIDQWHPGYYLPTAAGGYLGALSSAALGFGDLAIVLFGYGTLSWLLLGSLPLQRALTPPRLPEPLVPTLAILVAPPAVAGVAWFEMNGNRVDAVALALGGYAVLMVLVQVRAVPTFRTVRFGAGYWAFSFSYAVVTVDAIRWLSAERTPYGEVWTYLLLAVLSVAMIGLVGRTLVSLLTGTLLPVLAQHASRRSATGSRAD